MARADQLDRATAALAGVALGDAMGMPSQTLARAAIAAAYGRITDFVDPVADHPVSHGLRAAMVTDDTEQTLLLADVLLAAPGRFDDLAWAQALIGWEERIRARGLRDLLGPSSKAALDARRSGAGHRPPGHHQRRRDAGGTGGHRHAGDRPFRAGRPG
jgi:ADP-ribosylglycohydrolase